MTEKPPSAKEIAFRREAALKAMLNTPHKPHATEKKKPTAKKAKKAVRKRVKV